jgi:sRNA-binding carbon storage regulator CsrA
MLVLERKSSESVVLVDRAGNVIGRVRVIERGGGSTAMKLGFEGFDRAITIDREEVYIERLRGVRK